MYEAEVMFDGRTFIFVHSDENDHIFRGLRDTGQFYEIALLERLIGSIKPGDLVLDIGANIGTHSVFFAAVCQARVIAFEPNPMARALLIENVARNGLNNLIDVRSEALGASAGRGRILLPQAHNMGMAQVDCVPDNYEEDAELTVCALDDLKLPDMPKLLKIDVEGMEPDILDGAVGLLFDARPDLVIECSTEANLSSTLRRLEPLGYGIFEVHNFTPTYLFKQVASAEQNLWQVLGGLVASYAFLRLERNTQVNTLRHELKQAVAEFADANAGKLMPLLDTQVSATHSVTHELKDGFEKLDSNMIVQHETHLDVLNKIGSELEKTISESRSGAEQQIAVLFAQICKDVGALQREVKAVASAVSASDMQASVKALAHGLSQVGDALVASAQENTARSEENQASMFEALKQYEHSLKNKTAAISKMVKASETLLEKRVNLVLDRIQRNNLPLAIKRLRDDLSTITQTQLAEVCLAADGLWEEKTDIAPKTEPIAIPYFAKHFADNWDGWHHFQATTLKLGGEFEIRQDVSTPGIRSAPLDVPGPGLHEVNVTFTQRPGPDWILRIEAARTGELLHPDTALSDKQTAVRCYLPQWISQITLKILTVRPRLGKSIALGEIRLSKLDDEGAYRSHSKLIGQPVIASIASIPSRRKMLYDAVHSLLPQCDEVRVYLNGYGDVPDFLTHPRVQVRRSEDHDDMGDAGKFAWFDDPDPVGYRVICDDDLVFPPDLVERLVTKVRDTGDHAIVGLHGILVRQPITEYYKPENRKTFHFQSQVDNSIPVHILGSGVMCAHSTQLPASRMDFMFRNMGDIWLAKHAQAHGIPLLIIDRRFKWVRENQQTSAYETIYANSLKRTKSAFDSSAVQDAVLKAMQPLSFQSVDRPTAVLVLGVGDALDLERCLDSFHRTHGTEYAWKIILLAVQPDITLKNALATVPIDTELHSITADNLANVETALNTRLASLNFEVGLYLDARWEFACHSAASVALLQFQKSEVKNFTLIAGSEDLIPGAPELGTPPQAAFFRPNTLVRLMGQGTTARAQKQGLWQRLTKPRNSDLEPDATSDALILARTLAGGLNAGTRSLSLHVGQKTVPSRPTTLRSHKSIDSFFDRTVVLNLERRPDRWAAVSKRLSTLDIKAERHRAVDGSWPEVNTAFQQYSVSPLRHISPKIPLLKGDCDFYLHAISETQRVAALEARTQRKAVATAGAWGYLRSMEQILENAITDGVQSILVLDDDVLFHDDTSALFENAVRELPENWKILQLGSLQYHWDAQFVDWRSQHLYSQKGASVGSHAVGLHRDILPFLLERTKRMELAYDVGPLSAATRAFPRENFVIYPNLAIQSLEGSDINSSEFQSNTTREEAFALYRWKINNYGRI